MTEPEYNGGEQPRLPAHISGADVIDVVGVRVSRLLYRGEPVITFAMVDQVHKRPDGTAGRNFRDNRGRFVQGEDFLEVPFDTFWSDEMRRTNGGNRKPITLITQRGYLKLIKPMKDDRAWMVQGEMIDHYFATRRGSLLPDFSNPAEAARAFADQYERAQLAIRTKAEIGSRREATAMNTASQAVKKANRLEIELDRHASFASVKRMEKAYKGREFDWRLLKAKAIELGLTPVKINDANYGEVNTYHADVWREVYGLEIPGEGMH